jgi:putrescine transport system substrate-binding protein
VLSIRPYVRYIHSSRYIADLASGDLCLSLLWSGDFAQARQRAREAGTSARLDYILPREGSMIFFDVLAIPADAVHPGNAHRFIDYLLRPEVAARKSRAIYPTPEQRSHLHAMGSHSQAFERELTRVWTRFKTGQ